MDNKYPGIITTQTSNGPVMAVDLTKLPDHVMLGVMRTAIEVSFRFGNGEFDVDAGSNEEKALQALSDAVDALDKTMIATVPGADLRGVGFRESTYQVWRKDVLVEVSLEEMTPVEIKATIHRLQIQGRAEKTHAETLERFLATGKKEQPAAIPPAAEMDEDAPAPDWRL